MNANLQDGSVDFGGTSDASALDQGDDGFAVDFTNVGDQSGFEAVPRGVYNAVVDDCTYSLSQASNNPMWTWKFEIEDGDHKGRKLFFHSVFAASSMPRTKKTLGILFPEGLAQQFKPKQVAESGVLLGRRCQIRVDIKPYQGEMRNNVRDVLPPKAGEAGGAGDFLG
jgi:hypothetical protein